MQLPGQPPASQPLMQRNASLGALHAPPSGQSNPMQAVPGQQQLPTSVAPQMLQQSMQQMPSQAPQLLLQQQAALQSSYQSSQQAIYQLQQQLQLMQQQSNLNQQPSAQVGSSAVSSTCNWTEHTSPEGFKYYYNSITRESKWEKPEEYVLYEQQQQKLLLLQQHQQNIAVQQLQSPPQGQSLPSMQPIQQLPQAQGQTQMHMKQQELNYSQFQAAGSIDPNRIQQGIPAAQERAWKN
ncbi:RNA binding [Zea mays]|nr:RNA binding [Zea mays]